MPTRTTLRRLRRLLLWTASLVPILATPGAQSLESTIRLTQYTHRSCRTGDAGLMGTLRRVAQTRDRYIWINTQNGLFRFDGVHFTKRNPPAAESSLSVSAWYLFEARDGSLHVGTDIPPARYQTLWLRILAAVLVVAIGTLAYEYRLRRYKQSLKRRFDERLLERTRLARDLHDTLLQTIQGSKIVADEARDHVDDARLTVRSLDRLSEWLDRASIEGRAALEALRNTSLESNDLVGALQRAAGDCAHAAGMSVNISTLGPIREMHPIARDEVCRIGYEAIRNACAHSAGNDMSIELQYRRRFQLKIRDNGHGVDEEILQTGKPGHFGLAGMRERASFLGGSLHITSSRHGTVVSVVIPGQAIYKHPPRGFRAWLSEIFRPIGSREN